MRLMMVSLLLAALPFGAQADTLTLTPTEVTEWKSVFGRIEARDRVPARAQLGGTLVELAVKEGDLVKAGDKLGLIADEKLQFQLTAIDATKDSLAAQLTNAEAELTRGQDLKSRGVITQQRLDALQTQVDVVKGQIASVAAERAVIEQQAADGAVLAPASGRVLDVPVAKGAVVMPGEVVATLGGGGIFLRIAVPERHATVMAEGDSIQIDGAKGPQNGTLERIYPQIENGRVVADVSVDGLSDAFVDARVLVRLPVDKRQALLVPQSAIITRSGLDFVGVIAGETIALRAIVLGEVHDIDGPPMVEVLTGLQPGDAVETDAGHAAATVDALTVEGAAHE